MRRIGIGDLKYLLGNFPNALGFVRRAFDLSVNGLFVFGFSPMTNLRDDERPLLPNRGISSNP